MVFERQSLVDAVVKAVESNPLFGKAVVEEGTRLHFNYKFYGPSTNRVEKRYLR